MKNEKRYKVTFEFLNLNNEWKEAELDNMGNGYYMEDCESLARQLIENSIPCRYVDIVEVDHENDM